MARAIYANCFPPAGLGGDLLLTDEPSVAEAGSGLPVQSPERSVDPEMAHRAGIEMWRMAYSWFRHGDTDDTVAGGISAGDLTGLEAAIAVLGPAARGALSMAAAIDQGLSFDSLVSVVPGREREFAALAADHDVPVTVLGVATGTALAVENSFEWMPSL